MRKGDDGFCGGVLMVGGIISRCWLEKGVLKLKDVGELLLSRSDFSISRTYYWALLGSSMSGCSAFLTAVVVVALFILHQ